MTMYAQRTNMPTSNTVYHDENMHISQPGLKKQAIAVNATRTALTDMSNRNTVTVQNGSKPLKPLLQSVLQPLIQKPITRTIPTVKPTILPTINVQLETSNIDAMLISPQPVHKQRQKLVPQEPLKLNVPIDQPSQLSTSHLYTVEYSTEIMSGLYARESIRHVNNTYMATVQHDINAKMREILIDWLHEVSSRFKLQSETMHLTVNIVDRFLAVQPVMRSKLQLVGCAAMLIASKYQEIYVAEINDFVHISDNAYTRQDIINTEQAILNVLEFNCTTVSSLAFIERYILYINTIQHDTQQYYYCLYIVQLCLQNYDMLQYQSSTVAAAALYCALQTFNTVPHHWSAQLEHELHIDPVIFKRCVYDISVLLCNANTGKYQAVTRKFNRSMYKQASSLNNIKTPIII